MIDDETMLRRCLAWVDEHEEAEERFNVGAFRDMLSRFEAGRRFSEAQRSWIAGVYEKLFDEPQYSNDWSAGKVPLGFKEVPAPKVLQNLPKKPPGR